MNKLEVAAARAAQIRQRGDRPSQRRRSEHPGSLPYVRATLAPREIRSATRNGMAVVEVGGYGSVTESPYEMYDMFGPYSEVVERGAFAETLARSPLVEFALNHGKSGGPSMASTRNDTLELAEDDTGLAYSAFVDPRRRDVGDMLLALERGDLAEASFKFRIDSGMWSPDYTEFRIKGTDLDRGDVSAVNFGANPAATSGLRSAHVPEQVRAVVRRDLRGLAGRLAARAVTGSDVATLQSLLSVWAAADAAIDPIVDALSHADYALDTGLLTLSSMLGVPNPDADAEGGPLSSENDAADDLSRARTRALLALAIEG